MTFWRSWMPSLTGQPPLGPKPEKPAKKPRAKKAAPVEVPEVEADDLGEIPDFLDDLDVGE